MTSPNREDFITLYHSMSESVGIISLSTLLALFSAGFMILVPAPGTIIAAMTIASVSIVMFLFGALGYLVTEQRFKKDMGINPFRILPYKIRWVKVK